MSDSESEEIFFRERRSEDEDGIEVESRQCHMIPRSGRPQSQSGDDESDDDDARRITEDGASPVDEIRTISQTMRSMAGVLKDVVVELKSLKGQKEGPEHRDVHPPISVAASQNRGDRAVQVGSRNNNHWLDHDNGGRRHVARAGDVGVDNFDRALQRQPLIVENGNYQRQPNSFSMGQVKIPPFTGQEEWRVWINRFETIARRYQWGDEVKLDYMLPRLEGQAGQFAFNQLPVEVLNDYEELKRDMDCRFRVIETSRTYAVKFSRRNQRAGETAEEYAEELKTLYDKAHLYRARAVREEDLVRRFLDGLRDDEARFDVEYHKEPRNIDEAVYHVVNYIQTRKSMADKRHMKGMKRDRNGKEEDFEFNRRVTHPVGQVNREVKVSEDMRETEQRTSDHEGVLQQILQRLGRLERSERGGDRRSKRVYECYRCHKEGHFARECPEIDGNFETKGRNQFKRQMQRRGVTDNSMNQGHLNGQGPALVAKGWSN